MFVPGLVYTKWDIYRILAVPTNKQRGEWDKGYRSYQGNIFIFANIGIPGRTGHDYNNYWDGDLFYWEASTYSHLQQPQIQSMIRPKVNQKTYLFTRADNRSPFTFEGNVMVKSFLDTKPVKIIWSFEHYPYGTLEEREVEAYRPPIYEGAISKICVNRYERNPLARRMCIEHYGAHCSVCNFDFYSTYGPLGQDFIHIHHIVPIATIKAEYELSPVRDLIPVCPNCHSMLHRRIPALTVQQLKEIILAGDY